MSNLYRAFILLVGAVLAIVGINNYLQQNNMIMGSGVYSGYFVVVGNYTLIEGEETIIPPVTVINGTAVVDGRVLPLKGHVTKYEPRLFTGLVDGTAVFTVPDNGGYVVMAGKLVKVGQFYILHGRAVLTNVYLYYLK